MRSLYRRTYGDGPGGIKCPCCRRDTKAGARRTLNRKYRRACARELRAEMLEVMTCA
jgi:hypothetical protein